MASKIVFIVFLCAVLLLTFSTSSHGAAVNRKRSIDTKPPVCMNSTPCGWAVYTPFTRNVEHFMKNTCECPSEKQCVRTDDDLSVSAYVYRCRVLKTNK